MKQYGFLFGAGAELAYNLPSGGQFALEIFRQNTAKPKETFRKMRGDVDQTTTYANDWLPENYKAKNINVFGKGAFENIISSTVEHNRSTIIRRLNDFDSIASEVVNSMDGVSVKDAFKTILERDVSNIKLSQKIAYNSNFQQGNHLFESHYFSALLLVYKECVDKDVKSVLRRILLSIMQLQLGALSEDLSRSINDNLFIRKDDDIDIFDDFGELIQVNYKAAGISGLELLLENRDYDTSTQTGIIQQFAQKLIENIYASVLDYKSLIDSNWHNLYCPRADWAKFCKMAIFLLTVRDYIVELGVGAKTANPDGYYNMLKDAISDMKFEASSIATTNYNCFIEEILEREITYLNGSTSVWYDPYLNSIGTEEELIDDEKHIIVPLLFTQSGTKPMTAISMSEKYVDLYRAWKNSDAIVVVGFGFGQDDEHINSILRTLVNVDGKNLIIVNKFTCDRSEICQKLKIRDDSKIQFVMVDDNGRQNEKRWVDLI